MTSIRRSEILSALASIRDPRELLGFADQLHLQHELTPEVQGVIATRKAEIERRRA